MTCIYRGFNTFTNKWYCRVTLLRCPEASLEGFDYEECSTYLGEKKE